MTLDIELQQVAKTYRRGKLSVPVLQSLDMAVAAGTFLALMGPSGSGKTTLLNLIAGLDRPSSGTVRVAGQCLDTLSPGKLAAWRARHVGFVFQFYNLLPALNAARNVEVPLLLTDLSRAQRRQRIATALQLVGLPDHADHKPSELSGGQQQRVAIARAFVADPRLLVCDEPTGDLDRDSADEILALLSLLNREQGKTILMVTHDARAAAQATQVLHMDKGRLVDAGERAS